jgi:hypothetical protein
MYSGGVVGVEVNTDVLALREGKGDRGAPVEIGEINGAEKGIIGHHRIQDTVEGSEIGGFSGSGARREKTVTSRPRCHEHVARRRSKASGKDRGAERTDDHFSFTTLLY